MLHHPLQWGPLLLLPNLNPDRQPRGESHHSQIQPPNPKSLNLSPSQLLRQNLAMRRVTSGRMKTWRRLSSQVASVKTAALLYLCLPVCTHHIHRLKMWMRQLLRYGKHESHAAQKRQSFFLFLNKQTFCVLDYFLFVHGFTFQFSSHSSRAPCSLISWPLCLMFWAFPMMHFAPILLVSKHIMKQGQLSHVNISWTC